MSNAKGAILLEELFQEFPTEMGAKAVGLWLFYYIQLEETVRKYPGAWTKPDAWMPRVPHLQTALKEGKSLFVSVQKSVEEFGIPPDISNRVKSRIGRLTFTEKKAIASRLPF